MPFYHHPRNFTPLAISAEKKAIKNGLHHSIFTSKVDRYIGQWKNDLKQGKGVFLTCKGKMYEDLPDSKYVYKPSAQWVNYKVVGRHGYGTLSKKLPNGTYKLEYRGEWARGKPEGMGWKYYDSGAVYFGFWRRGQRHGYGKMWYADGTFYVGYWNTSEREGRGMFVQVNGNRYEGNWDADTKHGVGRFYHLHTGQLQEGCWQRDVCVKSKISDIEIRQFCDLPTEYPIPQETLCESRMILEQSELWLKQKICNIDEKLKFCIDQM